MIDDITIIVAYLSIEVSPKQTPSSQAHNPQKIISSHQSRSQLNTISHDHSDPLHGAAPRNTSESQQPRHDKGSPSALQISETNINTTSQASKQPFQSHHPAIPSLNNIPVSPPSGVDYSNDQRSNSNPPDGSASKTNYSQKLIE